MFLPTSKKTVKFHWDEKKGSSIPAKRLVLLLVGRNTDYKGAVYLDNIKIAKESEDDKGYVVASLFTIPRLSASSGYLSINLLANPENKPPQSSPSIAEIDV